MANPSWQDVETYSQQVFTRVDAVIERGRKPALKLGSDMVPIREAYLQAHRKPKSDPSLVRAGTPGAKIN
jgi:hypothetical protein